MVNKRLEFLHGDKKMWPPKKSADVLRGQGHSVMALLAAARDLPQDAFPATKSRFRRPPKTTKHTDDLL